MSEIEISTHYETHSWRIFQEEYSNSTKENPGLMNTM